MTSPALSVLTLARGRSAHLANLVLGLARQDAAPSELVIAAMQETPYEGLPDAPFPIRQIQVPGDALPLSRARNAAAAMATGDVLAFVDVDCIPAPSLVTDYAALARPGAGLFMGEVLYLPAGAADPGWSFGGFEAVAVRHSDRQGPPPGAPRACDDYRCFWSLNFAMHRDDWRASGGFDERYEGYGGEDTDFGRNLQEAGMPIWWMRGARVYHQHHPHCMPPVHAIPSILRNSELFASKWGYRTMEHWIHAFRKMGLVEITETELRILRPPGEAEYALCRQTDDMPYAATARVVRLLEDRERRARGLDPEEEGAPGRRARMVAEQERIAAPAAAPR